MENNCNNDIYPLYIDRQYCFDYDDFTSAISSFIDQSKSISDIDKQSIIEQKILHNIEPLIYDGILVKWLLCQSVEEASELAKTIIEAIESGKDPIKVVRHILLTLGFL